MSNERTGGRSQNQPNSQITNIQDTEMNSGIPGGQGTAAVKAAENAARSRSGDISGSVGSVSGTRQNTAGSKDFGQSRSIAGTAGVGESQHARDRRYFLRGPQNYTNDQTSSGSRKGLWAALIGVGAGLAAVYFLGQNRGREHHTELRSLPDPSRAPRNSAQGVYAKSSDRIH